MWFYGGVIKMYFIVNIHEITFWKAELYNINGMSVTSLLRQIAF